MGGSETSLPLGNTKGRRSRTLAFLRSIASCRNNFEPTRIVPASLVRHYSRASDSQPADRRRANSAKSLGRLCVSRGLDYRLLLPLWLDFILHRLAQEALRAIAKTPAIISGCWCRDMRNDLTTNRTGYYVYTLRTSSLETKWPLMHSSLIRACLIASSIAFAPAAQAALPSAYQIIRLGPLPGNVGSAANDLNSHGQSVGASSPTGFLSFDVAPTLWNIDQPTPLDLPADTFGTSLNAQSNVTGNYFPNGIGGAIQHAYYWNGSTFEDIHPPQGVSSYGLGINDANEIAGYYSTLNVGDQAFAWQNGAAITLGTLGGQVSRAHGINQAGQVAGGAETPNQNLRAFLWHDDNASGTSDPGEMVQLTDLGLSSAAYAVNDGSQAVGFVLNAQFQFQPAFWNLPSELTQLALPAGKTFGEALDINNLGQIVGTSQGSALTWSGGAVADLNALIPQGLGWTLLRANAVNDAGWIVGNGLLNGSDQAFLLVPVPEPSAVTLVAIGTAVYAAYVIKRRRERTI